MTAVDLSVIIPTYNSRPILAQTLQSALAQDFPKDRYEIVVLDDGSTDGTSEMVAAFQSGVPLTYHRQGNLGRAAARNAGSRLARGRILLYLDSDIIAAPDLLSRHYRHFERNPGHIGVQGRTLVAPEAKITPFMKTRDLMPDLTPRRRDNLSPYHLITRNLSIRTDDFRAVGGFDEHFPGYGWEDIELGLRLRGHGVRFHYDSKAVGYHNDVETLARAREKRRQAGEGAVYFWHKYHRSNALGFFLEIHPGMLWLKWLVYRTGLVGTLVRNVLPWAERREHLWIGSECYNYMLWEAYYDGVFTALKRPRS